MTTAFVVRGSSRYHADAACQALDSARLNTGGTVLQITANSSTHTPCLVCVEVDRTEWTLTPANLAELWELIGPSKPHYAAMNGRTEVDGLTIWAHNGMPRTVARFGDTITRHTDGTWTVQAATEVRS
ncbi:hypothetical protein [Kitasatospora sp. NPDC087314]|uniref:hypothetical protein n=1 Tax=Kitasatospora sp. NPDC087314 TaxID=3364068 RepID=UPI00381A16DB